MVFKQALLLAVVVAVGQAAVNSSAEVRDVQEVEEQPIVRLLPSLIRASVGFFQGRGRGGGGYGGGGGKKGGGGLVAAMMMGATMMAIGMAALAALSGKAMAAAMAALMLAAASLMKKGSDGGHSTYEVIAVPGHHGGHHGHRSLHDDQSYEAVTYEPGVGYGF